MVSPPAPVVIVSISEKVAVLDPLVSTPASLPKDRVTAVGMAEASSVSLSTPPAVMASPPAMLSVPKAPVSRIVSASAPPEIVSLPAPPSMVSEPSPPKRLSAPASPRSESVPAPA